MFGASPYMSDDIPLSELDPSLAIRLQGNYSIDSRSIVDCGYSPYTICSEFGSMWTIPVEEELNPLHAEIVSRDKAAKKAAVFTAAALPARMDTTSERLNFFLFHADHSFFTQ
jgi:hypothetical protein